HFTGYGESEKSSNGPPKPLLLPAARGRLRPRVVAALGAHHHLAVSLGLGLHSHHAETARSPRIGGLVADRVLMADVVGYGLADLIHFIQRFRKERDSTGALGNDLERAPGPLGMFFLAQDSDGIHLRTVFFLQVFHRLLEILVAGIVFAVGYDEQHFLVQSRIPL